MALFAGQYIKIYGWFPDIFLGNHPYILIKLYSYSAIYTTQTLFCGVRRCFFASHAFEHAYYLAGVTELVVVPDVQDG